MTRGKNPTNEHCRCQQHEEKQSQLGGQRLTGKGVIVYLDIMRIGRVPGLEEELLMLMAGGNFFSYVYHRLQDGCKLSQRGMNMNSEHPVRFTHDRHPKGSQNPALLCNC